MHGFEKWMATRSELFSLLTFPHKTTFTLVNIYWYKHLGDKTVLAREMFSSGCFPGLKNTHA